MPPIRRAIRTKGKVGRKRNVSILELGQGLCLVPQPCPTLWDPIYCSLPGSSVHGDSPGKNIGVGCHACLQGIFPTQGSNLGLLHYRWILYCLSHQGSPRILEWVAYPFSRGTSWPRNRNRASWIAGGFSTSWATREALVLSERVSLHPNFLEFLLRYNLASPRWSRPYRNVHPAESHYQKNGAHYVARSPRDLPGGPIIKNLPVNAGDTGSIPALGRSHMPWGN